MATGESCVCPLGRPFVWLLVSVISTSPFVAGVGSSAIFTSWRSSPGGGGGVPWGGAMGMESTTGEHATTRPVDIGTYQDRQGC